MQETDLSTTASTLDRARSWLPRQGLLSWYWLCICITPLVFVPVISDAFELPKLLIFSVLSLGLFIVSLWNGAVGFGKLAYLLVGLALWSGISTIWSVDILNSLFGFYARYTNGVFFFIAWGAWVLVSSKVLEKDEERKKVWWSLVMVSLLVALWGIVQRTGLGFYSQDAPAALSRTFSFMGNPNFSAMFIAALLPIALWLSGRLTQIRRFVVYGGVIVGLASLVVFASRGALLGAGVSLGMWFGLELLYGRVKWLSVVLLALAGLLLFPVYNLSRTPSASLGAYSTSDSRLYAWNTTVEIISEKPLLGTGPGNYFLAMREKGPVILSSTERFDDPHNIFLLLAATLGLPGLVLFLSVLSLVLFRSYRTLKTQSENVAVFAGLCGLLVSMCFNPVTVANWMLLGTFLGVLAVAKTGQAKVARGLSRLVITVVAALCLLVYGGYTVLLVFSDYHTLSARTKYMLQDYPGALKSARLAKDFLPLHADALNIYAAALIRTRAPREEAEQVISSLEGLHKNSSGVYMASKNLWLMLYRQSSESLYAAKAAAAADQVVKLEPRYGNTVFNASYMYFLLGQLEEAEELTRQTIVLEPDKVYPRILLAKIYSLQNKHKEALNMLQSAYKLDPLDWSVELLWRANKEREAGQPLDFPMTFPDFDIQ